MLSPGNSTVGREIEHKAVLEVAERLQVEGLARLDNDAASALVALRESFALQRQYGDDADQLCRSCSALCRALTRVPSGRTEAVTPLLQALDTLEGRETRAASASASSAPTSIHQAT